MGVKILTVILFPVVAAVKVAFLVLCLPMSVVVFWLYWLWLLWLAHRVSYHEPALHSYFLKQNRKPFSQFLVW